MLHSSLGGVAVRGLLLAALAALVSACDQGNDGKAGAAPAPPPVTVATPLVHKITEWDEFTGRFEATATVDIRARVSGYLDKINFVDGAIVKQGDVLFVIDPRPYQAAVDRAKADLAAAQARLELAQQNLDRAASLVKSSVVSVSNYDERVQERRSAEAGVQQSNAALTSAQLNLDFTQVRAPLSGRISDRRVDVGNLVTGDPSATLLTTIVALDPIYFAFDMSEADFLTYQRAVARGALPSTRDQGTVVEARLPDERSWVHKGTMNFVDNRLDPGSGTIRARAIFPNPDYFITPNQFGRIRVPSSNPYEAILIPDSAIVTDQSNQVVLTVAPDGTVAAKQIRPGPAYSGGLRIVRSGLEPTDTIIISGLLRARPGAKVTPQKGTIDAPSDGDT